MRSATLEQTNKYLNALTSKVQNMKSAVPEINKLLYEYGVVYNQYKRNITTNDYRMKVRKETMDKIAELSRGRYVALMDELTRIKEEYIKELLPDTVTTDPAELSLISKELEVMDEKELKDFYSESFTDPNKKRLFDIELKRRTRSGKESVKAEAEQIRLYADNYRYTDNVTEQYDSRIKIADSGRQLSGSGYVDISFGQFGSLESKTAFIGDMMKLAESNFAYGVPDPNVIDITEIMK